MVKIGLRMLFDDDGSEKGDNNGTAEPAERETKRVRDTEGDRFDVTKKVKLEPEEEDNLVIDENMVLGEDLSINSEESNDNDEDAQEGSPLGFSQETNANIVAGKRPSFESNAESCNSNSKNLNATSSAHKNGHDVDVSRVPKPASSSSSNQNSGKNYDDCNNSVDSNSSVNEKVLRLEKEIVSLASLLKSKEQEWNAIVRLKKLKEIEIEYLRRQKDVEEIFEEETIQQHEEYLKKLEDKINTEGCSTGPDEADVRSNINKTDKEIKEAEKKLKNSRAKKDKDSKSTEGPLENFKASLALQQLCERNRNSLAQANSPVQLTNNTNIQNKVIGEGRQGTIVEVRSIIADYRSKNPEETGGQDSRRRPSKKSNASQQKLSSGAVATSIISQNQNVSFKDVLVNLAKLSQNEKAFTNFESVEVVKSRSSKANNNASHSNSFNSQRGSVGTTLAKLLSSNNTSSNAAGEGNSATTVKIESVNHTSDSNLSLANLLASAKCRDEEVKTDDEDLVPVCQGCNVNRAQFVCAGCGNQWYCCRECQIQAWEEHSEICSG